MEKSLENSKNHHKVELAKAGTTKFIEKEERESKFLFVYSIDT
jgi:hypothetical protein